MDGPDAGVTEDGHSCWPPIGTGTGSEQYPGRTGGKTGAETLRILSHARMTLTKFASTQLLLNECRAGQQWNSSTGGTGFDKNDISPLVPLCA
jgi:hypothetical protein